ncbi:hypothetical protein M436DRAFT_59731 [Aureobasidium namibiae CBS 147.97]|uniref:Uncharacterized protein n=1 Tax=Aureobasidium namibiae CBS 147.97 TaxID=1043004 RepID=A0A074WX72_9PEZI
MPPSLSQQAEERNTDSRREYSSSYRDWLREQLDAQAHHGDARRGLLSSNTASQVHTISRSTLRRFRKNARKHGHLDHFLREADDAFADEMTEAYGVSRKPVPLLIPLCAAGIYLAVYAVLLREGWRNQACWESYRRGLTTIMQRVARRMGVDTTLPVMYLEVTEYDLPGGLGDYDIVGRVSEYAEGMETESVLPPPLAPRRSVWPQASSAVHSSYGRRVEASATGASIYLQ